MNEIVTHLMEVQFARGNMHLFLYTKCNSAKFFGDLGFYEIVRVDGQIVFMENRKTGFSGYLKLKKETCECKAYTDLANADKRCLTGHAAAFTDGSGTSDPFISALVMNANPFTLGHQYGNSCCCNTLTVLVWSQVRPGPFSGKAGNGQASP